MNATGGVTLEVENAFGAAKSGGLFRDMNMVYNFKKMKNRNECGFINNKVSFAKRLLAVLLLFFCVEGAWGATYRWNEDVSDGNWDKADNWEYNYSGSAYRESDVVPGEDDIVYIGATENKEITIPSGVEAKVKYIYTNSDDNKAGNVILKINGTLNVNALYTNTGKFNSGNTEINIYGTLNTIGDADINGSAANPSGIFTNSSYDNGNNSGSSGSTVINVYKDTSITNLYVNSIKPDTPNNNSNETKVNTGTKSLTVSGRIELNSRYTSGSATTLNISGTGSIYCKVLDFAIDKKTNLQKIDIEENASLYVTSHYFGDAEGGQAGCMQFTGKGNLYIPASGAYLDWGTTIAPDYSNFRGKIYASTDPSYYDVKVSGLNAFPDSSITVTLKRTRAHGGNRDIPVYFPYKITKLVKTAGEDFSINVCTAKWAAEETVNLAANQTGFLYFPYDTSTTERALALSVTGTVYSKDGFTMEIYTPDGARVLSTIQWYKGVPAWVGTTSSEWHNLENWTGLSIDGSKTDSENLQENLTVIGDLTINASATRMPVLSEGEYSLNALIVSANASFSISGGKLTVSTFTVADASTKGTIIQSGGELAVQTFALYGNSSFNVTSGTLVLENKTDDPVITADAGISNVILNNLQIKSGTFTTPFPLNVNGDLQIDSGAELSNTENVLIGGELKHEGTLSGTGKVIFNGTGDQTFIPKNETTYSVIELQKESGKFSVSGALKTGDFIITNGTNTTFGSPIEANNFNIVSAVSTEFNDAVTFGAFNDDPDTDPATDAGNIFFNKGGSIGSATIFKTNGEVTFSGSDVLDLGTNPVTIENGTAVFKGKIKASKVTIGNGKLESSSAIDGALKLKGGETTDNTKKISGTATHTLTINGNLESDGYYNMGDSFAQKITLNPKTNSYTNIGTTAFKNITLTGNLINRGTLSLENSTVNGDISNTASHSFTIAEATTLNGSLTNAGTFTIKPHKVFKISKNFSNNGTVSANDESEFKLTGDSAISGTEFAVNHFTAENLGGKTITLNTDVTVNGKLSLSGSNAGSRLRIIGDSNGHGFILTNGSQPSSIDETEAGKFLIIGKTVQIKSPGSPPNCDGIEGTFYKASNSVPDGTFSADAAGVVAENAAYANVLNNGWRIKELSDFTYTWTGNADNTDWADRRNWDIGIVPGVTSNGQTKSSGAVVIIPDGKTLYPKLGTISYNLSSLTIGTSDSVSHNASVTLGGTANLSVVSSVTPVSDGILTNNSQIIYSSSGRIKGAFSVINDSEKGSVEYNTATGTIADVDYFDLKITGGKWKNTDGKTVTVKNKVIVENTPEISFNNGFVCKGSDVSIPEGIKLSLGGKIKSISDGESAVRYSQTYNTEVSLSDDAEFQASEVTFKNTVDGEKKLTIDGNAVFEGKVGDTDPLISISVTGTSEINGGTVTTTESQIYNGAITLGNDAEFQASKVTFKSTVDGEKKLTIDGNAVFEGKVGDTDPLVSISVKGTSEINGGTVTTTENQIYNGEVTLGNDADFSGNDVNFKSAITGDGKALTLNSEIAIIEGNASVKDFISNAKLKIKNENDVTVTTSGNIEINNEYDFDKVVLVSGGKTSFNESGKIGTATITNEGVLELAQDKTITVSGKLTQNGNGKNDIKGSIVSTESASLSFSQNVYINGSPSESLSLGGSTGNVSIDKNLIIALENQTKELIVNSPLEAENIVLFSGKLSANKNLTSQKDIVLLGKEFKSDDGVTGHSGEYLYNKKRNVDHNYKGLDFSSPETLPDGSEIPDGSKKPYEGELSVAADVSLTVGKNFYANGLNLSGKGKWYLYAGENSDSSVCFVEAYKCNISNSVVRNIETKDSEGTTGMAEACNPVGENENWDFEEFKITDVETVNDSVLKVTFNKPIRNKNNELSSLVRHIHYNNGEKDFYSVYETFGFNDGWSGHPVGNQEKETIYLQTQNNVKEKDSDYPGAPRWNTDANGTFAGKSASTDSYGVHQKTLPNLKFDRNVKSADSAFDIVFTDQFGKILKDSGTIYDIVSDGASPVLVKVTTGQENHTRYYESTGASSQPSYDAHNFIEFVYSEPVDFDNTSNSGTLTLTASQPKFENVQVQDSLGAITESNGKLTVAGLASFNGALSAGDRRTGKSSSTVHSLYRKSDMNSHTVRISIAGLVDGTITDNDGNEYKNWIGYIDNAETPSGQVTLPRECPVFDLERNRIQSVKTDGLSVSGALWDVIKPSFAIYRKSAAAWNSDLLKGHFEAIGSTVDGTSSLKRIEFHMFDNTPTYDENDSAYWVSRKGWVSSISVDANLVSTDSENGTFAADDFGGSRMFVDSNRTSGGIRYSSIVDSAGAFKHITGDDFSMSPDNVFDETKKAYFNVTSPIFIATEGAVRTPNYADSPYFGLTLKETIPSLKTTFIVSYDDTKGFVTDLAGNRLESARIRTIDTTPPSFVMSLAPVGQKKLYLMFAKRLNFDDTVNLKNLDSGESVNKKLLEFFPESFVLGKIDGTDFVESDLKIDANIKPVVHLGNSSVADNELFNNDYCSVELGLNREVTYDDVLNLYVQCKPLGSKFQDPVTGLHTKVATFVQDDTGVGNYLPAYSAHSLSDFAVNAVNPVYAYNAAFNAPNDASKSGLVQKNLFGENSFGVHDWDAEQKNFGTLLPEDEIHVIASAVSKDAMNARIYLDNSPENGSVSDEYNRISGSSLRVWLPEVPGLNIFKTIATKANPVESYFVTDGKNLENSDVPDGIDFSIPEETVKLWAPGDQVSFLFGMTENDGTDVRMCHSPVFDYQTEEYIVKKDSPLFALRLKDPADILSLDLWSFRLKEMILQKGGVTILNNVINAGKGEKAVVRVDNPKPGRVDVIVMTLDGNVIEYLHRGELESGNENYFTWNGKNRNGKAVARGMYFVRVIGNGFDETRKIMVVK